MTSEESMTLSKVELAAIYEEQMSTLTQLVPNTLRLALVEDSFLGRSNTEVFFLDIAIGKFW